MTDSTFGFSKDLTRQPELLWSFAGALVFVGAIISSLFFNGAKIEAYALAMGLLISWAGISAHFGLARKRLPGGAMLVVLLAFQTWLFISLFWNPVIYLGVGYFWLLATPLITLLGWSLLPDPDRFWRPLSLLLLVLGIALAVFAIYQVFWLEDQPRATFINKNSLAALLNLLIMIGASRVLTASAEGSRFKILLTLMAIGLFAYIVGLVGSRGAFLGLGMGLVVMVSVGWRLGQSHRRIVAIVAVVISGLAIMNFTFDEQLAARIATLSDPYSAGQTRFVIWNQSLDMLQARPMVGYGLGTYWQHWPQWRLPEDTSAGFWVHNDFLHLAIEAGLPAVILLAGVHLLLLWLFIRILRSLNITPVRKLEATALFCGLLAVAIHAQFTFNYYTLPILLGMSVAIARLARFDQDARQSSVATDSRQRWLKWLPGLVVTPLLIHFSSIGVAAYLGERGIEQLQVGNGAAERNIVLAQRLWPSADLFYYTHAWLKVSQLKSLPVEKHSERLALFQGAQRLLDQALENNPLRPIPYNIRGHLLVAAANLAGADWLKQAEDAFRESLRRDPRYLEGRMALAQVLAQTKRMPEAHRLLEEGAGQWYDSEDPNTLNYYLLLAEARTFSGDHTGAAEMSEKAAALQRVFEKNAAAELEK